MQNQARLGGRAESGDDMGTEQTKEQGTRAVPGTKIKESEVFRETFLFVLDPEEAEAFRHFGDVVQDRFLDRSIYEKGNPHFSFTLAEMVGVAADLRFLEGFLRAVGAERRLSELTATEQGLSSLAERLAPEVATLAGKLAQEIEHLIADEDEPAEASPTPGEG
jgi:hypothetical protein